jgi:RNA polymerase sigma-70 factor (ECF subfamily)
MLEMDTFTDLVRRVRAGEAFAAEELVRRYEPAIRRAVRIQMRDHRLRRLVDSVDICQSVLGSFFMRMALGQFELDKPEDLLKLLTTMARNNLAAKARHPRVVRRNYAKVDAESGEAAPVVADDPSPSRAVAGRELLLAVQQRLDSEERLLAEQRAHGRPWADIAAELGGSAEALRKKLTRALDRVALELGLEEMRS